MIRTSVLSDLEAKLFSEPTAERLHLIKLYGHLISGAPLPEAFAPRFEPMEYPREKGKELLTKLLQDPDPLVRGTAARAVVGLGEDAGQPILDQTEADGFERGADDVPATRGVRWLGSTPTGVSASAPATGPAAD